MSIRNRRLLLLGSSSLMLLNTMIGLATSQPQGTPQEPPQQTPSAPAPGTPAPTPAPAPAPSPAPAPGGTPTPSPAPNGQQTPPSPAPGTPAPAPEPAPGSPPPTQTPPTPPTASEPAPAPAPGTVQVPEITVTPPAAPPPPPATQPAPAPAPATPQPAAAPAPAPAPVAAPPNPATVFAQRTATFNDARANIYAPLGTAPTTISAQDIAALPRGDNTPLNEVLLQLPGVTKDSAASGNFHVRNEHANVQYRINGITLPDQLSGFGQILDSGIVGNLSLITGAMPAQYGLRTAGIIDITTRSGAFDNTGNVGFYGGSRETRRAFMDYGGRTGSTEYYFSGSYLQNILGIENPTSSLNAIHDFTQQGRGFGYISTIIDPTTRLSLISGASVNKFQIPDTPGLVPPFTAFGLTNFNSAQLNENQIERNYFTVLALQKTLGDVDAQLSYFTRYSSVHFTPDPVGDLMFNGTATDVFRGSQVNGVQADMAWRVNDAHTLRTGAYVSAEKSLVRTDYSLLPIDATTGAQIQPDVPFGVVDQSALTGWLSSIYVSDEWRITDKLTVVGGLRYDQMNQYINANQVSPRASVIYKPTASTTFHAGYANYFTPPVQVIAAPTNVALISTCPPTIPNCTTTQAPAVPGPYGPVLPERSHVFDIGVVQDIFPGFTVGADAYFKYAKDLLDDGQFGAAYVLNGFNYDRGQNIGVEFKAAYTNGNFKAYANWAWARQKATNIVSNQYLFGLDEIAYIANHYIYTDHAQVWTGSAGMSYLWNDTRFSADLIYGSGLRAGDFNTDHVAPYAQVNMGVSHEFKFADWKPVTARFDVINVFDTIYQIRSGSGIGVFAPQFGPRRGFYFGLSQKFGPGSEKVADATNITKAPTYKSGMWFDKPPMFAKAPIAAIWTWTGFYLGGNLGDSFANSNTDATFFDPTGAALFGASGSSRFNGIVAGGQAGYNWQFDNWLAGFEADIQGTGQKAQPPSFICPGGLCNPAAGTAVGLDHSHKLDWYGTLRGRFGAVVTPDVLLYGTAGAAVAGLSQFGWINPEVDANGVPFISGTSANLLGRATKWGWVAGAGIEARLIGNWVGRIEYLHLDFGTVSFNGVNPAIPIGVALDSHLTDNVVRVGLSYKFDPFFDPYFGEPKARAAAYKVVGKSLVFTKAPIEPRWTFAGYYLGASAGYSWGKSNTDALFSDGTGTALFAAPSTSAKFNGGIFGAQTGYNWLIGNWLVGIEGDLQISGQRAKPTFVCPDACNPFGPAVASFDLSQKMEWFATLRGRFGATVTPDVLLYATTGLAVGGFMPAGTVTSFDDTGAPVLVPFDTLKLKAGWAAGLGVEAHLGGPWTGKVEYLHLDFGRFQSTAVNDQSTPVLSVDFNQRITDNIVRFGLNYKFATEPTVTAKY
jgi:opacity protein-like surface antigen